MKRDAVDFSMVPVHQQAMDARLANWARSLYSSAGSSASPMFRLYRSSDVHAIPHVSTPYDAQDAIKIAKGVRALPDACVHALNWAYIKPGNPRKACQQIGCTMAGLAQYVIDGRQMLLNRGV
jgi:hypothetical protein